MFAKSIVTKGGDVFRDEYSLAFDGTNDYVDTSFVPDYISTNATTAFWVKMNDFSSDQIMGFHNNKRWYHGFSSSSLFIGVANAHNGSSLITPSPALVVGQWIHYCVTAIDGTATVYINGVAQGTMSYTQSSGTDPDSGYFIGARDNSGAGQYLNCNISEVVHYNIGLTASQVKTIYNGREPYNHKEGVASGNLQAWHRMGDGIIDRIGKNAHTNTGAIADMSNYTLGTDVLGGKGDFSDASYWTITSGQSIVEAGVGKFLGNGSYGVIQKSSVLTANKIYLAKVTCSANAGAPVHFNFGDPFPQIIPDNETGEFSICFVAGNTNVILYATTYNEAVTIDNLTIQEVGGNAGAMINMAVDDFEGDTP